MNRDKRIPSYHLIIKRPGNLQIKFLFIQKSSLKKLMVFTKTFSMLSLMTPSFLPPHLMTLGMREMGNPYSCCPYPGTQPLNPPPFKIKMVVFEEDILVSEEE
jgi:hypothetical protein